jgi:hypothetical protein
MLGMKRMEYLDLSLKANSTGDFQTAEQFLKSFLATVEDGSEMSKDIKKEFDRIDKTRVNTWNKLCDDSKSMDSWTQSEFRGEQRIQLALEALYDRIDSCWKIALKLGGFND